MPQFACVSLSRLERDVSQKRSLLDDMKLKLTDAQRAAENDADVMVLTTSYIFTVNLHLILLPSVLWPVNSVYRVTP